MRVPFLPVGLLFLSTLFIDNQSHAQKAPVDYVATMIGTAPSATESARAHSEAGSELKGQTIPAVGVPNGMTQWTPQTRATETKCIAPFYYNDNQFQGFRGTHWLNGSCVQDYGSVTIMPLSGELITDAEKRASVFSHDKEQSLPDHYSVWLPDHQVNAEVTALARTAIMRFRYDSGEESFLLIEPNSDEGEGFVEVLRERGEVVGYNPVHRIYQGSGQPAGISGYFVMKFDKKIIQSGVWLGDTITPMGRILTGTGKREKLGAYVGFGDAKQVVTVRIGTSFTSIEGARANLEKEMGDKSFEVVQKLSRDTWNASLGKVKVSGSDNDKVLFYSALYRTKQSPRLLSDVDGSYPSFAGGTPVQKTDGFDYYCDFSLWDTFRAAMPLEILLEPRTAGDMVQSLVKKAEQGGWMPIFPCWNHYTAAMVGDHGMSVVADAYAKNIRNFDVNSAYNYLRKNAFEVNTNAKSYEAGQGRRALKSYLQYGYVPLEDSVWQAFHKREQVSRTLEYAYDDFCLSILANGLSKKEDAAQLRERALNYRHVIDPSTGYARGRHADSRWIGNFDPFAKRVSFITEGSPAQYTWFVPQDMAGLQKIMGGKDRFVQKLDTLFDQGHYWHGNEPNHQIAYLYAFAGEPWKTQQWTRTIIRNEYDSSVGGLSGNEDGGQMSAWLAFSMMGFYPVAPGTDQYVLGSPVFEEMSVETGKNRRFTVTAKGVSDNARYIQSATLNGKPFTRTYLTHGELLKGGSLVLQMAEEPNKQWGAQATDRPFSLSKN
ncbi:GH92 family glycosyl hydrolase [Dyadobacter fermentans]|uniref:Alpha-1,2-mannosidase n=1 Tax=Dyadobacter fermentans (strain ATCC 700827 / DSM 18053 / CIP 107007 / KCTC 52180 / NS114) TaxID=471854 RepID=C6W4W9_DYAFD|nr:GH92 family glycosyl hydrolase [Dyadobacter fermentans]ACT95943.1 alpha-1,2-mannosidase [Dyadobacter fermentans DSM 18053]